MIYYNQWKDENGTLTFTFDDQVFPVEDGFNVLEDHPIAEEMLDIWLSQESFLGTDGEMHNLADEPNLFLSDFIPRVCGFKSNMKTADKEDKIEIKSYRLMSSLKEGPNMIPLSEIIPEKFIHCMPIGAEDIQVSDDYKGGKMVWLPGPYLQIMAKEEDSEIIIGTFPDGGVLREAIYVDDNDRLAPKGKATHGESYLYGPGKVMIMQALLVAPFDENINKHDTG